MSYISVNDSMTPVLGVIAIAIKTIQILEFLEKFKKITSLHPYYRSKFWEPQANSRLYWTVIKWKRDQTAPVHFGEWTIRRKRIPNKQIFFATKFIQNFSFSQLPVPSEHMTMSKFNW